MKNKSVSKTLTSLFVLLVTLFALMAFGACGESSQSGPQGAQAGLSPVSTVWVKGESHDLIFAYTGGLTALREGKTELAAEHYTAAEGTLTIKESYLSSLTAGTHAFTALFGEETVQFTVGCYAMPTVTPAEIQYDWSDPKDVTLEVDLGGSVLVAVKMGGEALDESEYTLSGTELTLSQTAIESRCANGDNACEVKTDVGSAYFNINAMTTEVTFDPNLYKIQEKGKDVRFAFNAGREEWTIESFEDGKYTVLAQENYSYEIGSLVLKGSYLDTLNAGAHSFRITSGQKTFTFVVGVYGKEGTAHPIENTAYAMNNFDQFSLGASVLGTDETKDIFFKTIGGADSVIGGRDAVYGRSLRLTATPEGAAADWNTLFGARLPFRTGVTYFLTMKVRLLSTNVGNPTLVFRLDGPEQNLVWLDYNKVTNKYMVSSATPLHEPSSFSYEAGILTVSLYFSPDAEGQHFRFMTANAGAAIVAIDDFAVLATDIPAGTPVLGKGQYSTETKGDCTIPFTLPTGYTVKEVLLGDEKIAADGYTLGAGTLILKESAFAGVESRTYGLTVTTEYIADAFGGKATLDVTGSVQVYTSPIAGLKGEKMQRQTAAREALTWPVESGLYTLAGVLADGAPVEEGKYSYSENNFTLKPEFFSSVAPGAHTILLTFGQEGKDDIVVELSAVSYGNDVAHLADEVGYLNFNDYDENTLLKDIMAGKESYLRSWSADQQAAVKVVSDPVFGRALNIPVTCASSGVLSFDTYRPNTVYVLRMTFRVENDAPVKELLIKWNAADVNVSWIENGDIKSATDSRTTLAFDARTKVYTWTSYVTKPANEKDSLILWINPLSGDARQAINIGTIEFFETSLDDAGSWGKYNYLAVDGTTWTNNAAVSFSDDSAPLKIIQNMNDESKKYQHFSLMLGTRTLIKGTDYTAEGDYSHQNITLTPEFLKTIQGSAVLTVCRGRDGVLGMDGKLFLQTAQVTVTRT